MIKAIKRAWLGEEKLSIIFFLWFGLLYPASIILGVVGMFVISQLDDFDFFLAIFTVRFVALIFSVCGFIMIFLYPVILIVSIWRCSKNYAAENLFKLSILGFFPIHIVYSLIVLLAVQGFINIFIGSEVISFLG